VVLLLHYLSNRRFNDGLSITEDDEALKRGHILLYGNILKRLMIYILLIFVFWSCNPAAAQEPQVSRRYYDDGILKEFGENIILIGSPEQIIKLTRWLDQISLVPKGFETLFLITESSHELVIQHADHALSSAGRTMASMTMNLINGVGDSVQILFDLRIADSGSHMVYNDKSELIEYTAIQNLYHELAHAMHMMNGTWRYYASEAQAIEEENIFRRQLAELSGRDMTQRYRKIGILKTDVVGSPIY
jgi:hypothetical protein